MGVYDITSVHVYSVWKVNDVRAKEDKFGGACVTLMEHEQCIKFWPGQQSGKYITEDANIDGMIISEFLFKIYDARMWTDLIFWIVSELDYLFTFVDLKMISFSHKSLRQRMGW